MVFYAKCDDCKIISDKTHLVEIPRRFIGWKMEVLCEKCIDERNRRQEQ